MPPAFYAALPQIIKNYNTIGQHSRDESYFLQMYLGDYRAVEYLASRPDWDGKTIVVMGTSMGGQQSFAVGGAEPESHARSSSTCPPAPTPPARCTDAQPAIRTGTSAARTCSRRRATSTR